MVVIFVSISQNLKHLMDSKGLSNYQLAKDLDVHPTSIANWLSGTSKPIKRMQVRIADYFGITVENLAGDELPEPGERKEKSPTTEGERSVGDIIDEVDIAFYGDYRELDDDDKETIRTMVQVMRDRRAKKQE